MHLWRHRLFCAVLGSWSWLCWWCALALGDNIKQSSSEFSHPTDSVWGRSELLCLDTGSQSMSVFLTICSSLKWLTPWWPEPVCSSAPWVPLLLYTSPFLFSLTTWLKRELYYLISMALTSKHLFYSEMFLALFVWCSGLHFKSQTGFSRLCATWLRQLHSFLTGICAL